eukprot:4242147-Pyramimonas_sp.AAC.1
MKQKHITILTSSFRRNLSMSSASLYRSLGLFWGTVWHDCQSLARDVIRRAGSWTHLVSQDWVGAG